MPQIVYKVSICESFNNQSERKTNEYLSKRCNFALDNYQSVTQREGLELVIINKVKRYEKD
jgi:hypothetical protein